MNLDRIANRIARTEKLDLRKIEGFRKDFLTLMKNANRIDSYDKAHLWNKAISRWNNDFEDYLYKHLLTGLENAVWRKDVSKEFGKMWDDLVRTNTWPFVVDFRVPINLADDYYSKERRYEQFQQELKSWDRSIRGKARNAWAVLKNFTKAYEDNTQQLPEADVPVPEEMNIEGFPVIFKGHDTGYSAKMFPEHLAKMRSGLKKYKSRASKMLPMLLKHKLPIVVDYNCKFGLGGEYKNSYIALCFAAFDNVPVLIKVISHEMGHHLWRIIGGSAQDYWSKMLSGDLGKLDLRKVIKKYGTTDWIHDNKKIMRQDPFLYNQLMGLEYSQWGPASKLTNLSEVKEYLDGGGEPVLSVHTKPISGYSNKSPQEAFCEAIGLLVAYGPRTVHPQVRAWLKEIVPSLRTASDRIAIVSPEKELLKIARELLSVKVKKGWYYYNDKPKIELGRSGAVGVLRGPESYKDYLQGIGGMQGASMAENYIYHLPKNLNIFDDTDKGHLKKAYKQGVLTLEPSEDSWRAEKEYGSIDELISELRGHKYKEIWQYIEKDKLKKHWDGFYHFEKKDNMIWAYVNPSEFKLIDGNVQRFEQSGDVDVEIPDWVEDELLRYTDMAGKNIKPEVVRWLKENVPSKNKKLYRGLSFNYPDDNISKWIGISDIADVKRGAKVRLRRGRMSSWSTTPQIAKAFAMSGIKLLIAANVPSSKIIVDFTQLSSKMKSKFPFRAQNEAIVTGAVDGKIVSISANNSTVEWLEKHGYSLDRNGIYEIDEKDMAASSF